ncbi:MAG: hypothetical protein J5I47_04660 [Vicingus serpentipes]|nr:hypothetical protein [Vicingus serpentipes]
MDIEYKFICVDDIIYTPIPRVYNESLGAATGVYVQVYPPEGVTYHSSNFSTGYFDPIGKAWLLGTMKKNATENGEIGWKVLDDCKVPFKFTFKVGSTQGNVCMDDGTSEFCVNVDGLTPCIVNLFTPTRSIYSDYQIQLFDQLLLVYATTNPITLTLPDSMAAWRELKKGGNSFEIRIMDLTNPVVLTTGDVNVKIVDKSLITDANEFFNFTLVGQSLKVQSIGNHYITKV